MDVELAEIRDFLAEHAPFDTLPPHVLARLPRRCTLRYARRGSVVLEVGQRGDGLHLVRSGAVEVRDETGDLVDRVGTGGAFGMSSLLERRPTRYRCTAVEDTLLLVLAADAFDELVRDHHEVATFYAATHHDRLTRAVRNLQRATSGASVMSTRIEDLLTRGPVTVAPDATVSSAARVMSEAGVSSLLVVDDGAQGPELVGILTDRDLRNRVLARELDGRVLVRDAMTADPATIRAGSLAVEALLEMVARDIHHLPVLDGGTVRGLVTTTDLVRLENADPVHLTATIGRSDSLAAVVEQAARIPRVLVELVERDVTAADVSRVATALGDAVRRRVIALVEADLPPAPTAWSWVVLGSAAREEEGLSADQDHALVVAEEGHDEWFDTLASRVTAALEEAGWPRCPGDVMATNPQWRLTVDGWRRQFTRWSREPEPEAVLRAAIFHDMRHLAGDPALAEEVRRIAVQSASPRLLGHLAAQAAGARLPLGFFRGLVLERQGEHRDTLDIKRPIAVAVQIGRVQALRVGSAALPTRDRLAAAVEARLVDAGAARELVDALELMSYLRLHHQAAQVRAGTLPDNHLAPGDLTERQRRHLRDAFEIVRSAQQRLHAQLAAGFE